MRIIADKSGYVVKMQVSFHDLEHIEMYRKVLSLFGTKHIIRKV
jgi:hypothetical protein